MEREHQVTAQEELTTLGRESGPERGFVMTLFLRTKEYPELEKIWCSYTQYEKAVVSYDLLGRPGSRDQTLGKLITEIHYKKNGFKAEDITFLGLTVLPIRIKVWFEDEYLLTHENKAVRQYILNILKREEILRTG